MTWLVPFAAHADDLGWPSSGAHLQVQIGVHFDGRGSTTWSINGLPIGPRPKGTALSCIPGEEAACMRSAAVIYAIGTVLVFAVVASVRHGRD